MSSLNLHTLVYDLAELLYLFDSLAVSLSYLLDYLQWTVLLAEYLIGLVSRTLLLLYLHEVASPSSTLHMESYVTLRELTLHASAAVLSRFQTDNALQSEAPVFELGQSDWRLGSDYGPWDPVGAAEMHPLVDGLSWWVAQHLGFIAVQEVGVVVDVLLLAVVDKLVVGAAFGVTTELVLEVVLSLDDYVQTQVLVLIVT